jgi:phospholipid/cholesterol/gamma-HCH transport system permease protein
VEPLKAIGRHFRPFLQDGTRPVEFIGRVAAEIPPLLRHGMRWRDFRYYMNLCGVQALPIVLLICFLMGMVMAVNGQIQFRNWAGDFVVDAVGFVILKELGPLMVVGDGADRLAGSAFAAEIAR